LAVDLVSAAPEDYRRVFATELDELLEDGAGNLTLCMSGEFNDAL
jgi:hypothetical protein